MSEQEEVTRVCTKCGTEKPITEFNAQKAGRGGKCSYCRLCSAAASRQWYAKNRGAHAERHRKYYEKNPGKVAARIRRHRERHPERLVARNSVAYALVTGRLVRPESCERCGRDAQLQAHHHDYAKPLEVMWLCRACHRAEHGQQSEVSLTQSK